MIFVHWITATNGWSTVRLCIANAYNYESYKYDTIHDICNIFFVLETPESWGENHLGWNYLQNIVSVLVGFMLIFFGMEMSLYIVRGFLLESHHIFVFFSVFFFFWFENTFETKWWFSSVCHLPKTVQRTDLDTRLRTATSHLCTLFDGVKYVRQRWKCVFHFLFDPEYTIDRRKWANAVALNLIVLNTKERGDPEMKKRSKSLVEPNVVRCLRYACLF